MSPEDDYVDPWAVPVRQPRPKPEGEQEVPDVPQIPTPPAVRGIGRAGPRETAQTQSAPPEGFVQNADGSYGIPIPGELAPKVKPPKPEDLEASRRDRDMRNIFLEAVDANARRKYEREFFAFGALPAAENLREMDRSGRAKTFSDLWAWAQNNIDQDILPSAEEISKEMVERRTPQGVLKRLRNRAALLLEDLEGYSQKEARSSANAMTAEQAMQRIQSWEDAAQAFADANPVLIGMQRASESFLGPIAKATDPFVNMAIESGVPEADRESTVRRARNLARWAVQLRREQGGFLENLSADILPSLLPQIGSLTAAGRALSGGAGKLLPKVSGAFTEATESGIDMLTRRWVMEKLGQGVGLGLQQGAQAYLDPNATGTMAAREAAKSFLAAAAGGAAEDFVMGALGLTGRPRTKFGAGVANAMTELGVDYATAKAYGEPYTAEQAVAAALPGLAPWFHAAPKPKPGTPPAAGAPKPTTPPPAPPKAAGAPPAPPVPAAGAGEAPTAAGAPAVPAEAGGRPAAPVPAAKAVEGAWEALAPDGSKTELLVQHGPTGTMFKIGGLVNDEGGAVVLAANAKGQWTGQDNFSGIPIQMVASLEEGALKLRMFEVQEGGEAPVLIREVAFGRPGAAPATTAPTEAPPAETGGRPPAPPPSTEVPAAAPPAAKAPAKPKRGLGRKKAEAAPAIPPSPAETPGVAPGKVRLSAYVVGDVESVKGKPSVRITPYQLTPIRQTPEGVVFGEMYRGTAGDERASGTWWADSREAAKEYAESSGGKVYKAEVVLKRPFFAIDDAGRAELERLTGISEQDGLMETREQWMATLEKAGYDGLVIEDTSETVDTHLTVVPLRDESVRYTQAKRGLGRKKAEAPPTAPPPAAPTQQSADDAEYLRSAKSRMKSLADDGDISGLRELSDELASRNKFMLAEGGALRKKLESGQITQAEFDKKKAALDARRKPFQEAIGTVTDIRTAVRKGRKAWRESMRSLEGLWAEQETQQAIESAEEAAGLGRGTPQELKDRIKSAREEADKRAIRSAIEDVGEARTAKMDIDWASESRRQPQKGKANEISTSEESGTIMGNGPREKRSYKARRFNAYDESGNLVGTMSIIVEGYAPGAFKIAVRPDAMRRGYGMKLLDAAEASGIDMLKAMRKNSFSNEGRSLARSWLLKKLGKAETPPTQPTKGKPGGVGRAKRGKAPKVGEAPASEATPPNSPIIGFKARGDFDTIEEYKDYTKRLQLSIKQAWAKSETLPNGMHSIDYRDIVAVKRKSDRTGHIAEIDLVQNDGGDWSAQASVVIGNKVPRVDINGPTRAEAIAKVADWLKIITPSTGLDAYDRTLADAVLSWADGLIRKYGGEGRAARPETAAPPEAPPTQPTEGEPGPDVMESLGREEAGSPDERARAAMDEFARMFDEKVDDAEAPYIVQAEIEDAEIQIEYDPSKGGELFLRRIEAFSPGTGAGTRLLRRVKEVADRFGVSIKLYPDPFGRGVFRAEEEGGPTTREYRAVKSRLVNWYKREGFVRTSGGNLIYRPGAGAEAGPSTMESIEREEPGPVWRNNIFDQLHTWQQSGTPQQLLAHLYKARGAKYQAEWIGLEDFLAGKDRVTKAEVQQFVLNQGVRFRLSNRRTEYYERYRTPGGTNYSEEILAMPGIDIGEYENPHFRNEQNPIAVVARKTDRVSSGGENVIFVEEIQSDIASDARKLGRQEADTKDKILDAERRIFVVTHQLNKIIPEGDFDGIEDPEILHRGYELAREKRELSLRLNLLRNLPPNIPYETPQKYASLALKRIIRMAVDQGSDGIALASALDQVLRFGTEVVYWKRNQDASDGSPSFFVRASELEGVAELERDKPGRTLIGDASKFKTIDDVISVENVGAWANSNVIDPEDGGDAWDSAGPAQRSTGYDVKSKEDLLSVFDRAFSERTLREEARVKLAEKIWAKMAGTRPGEEGVSAPRAEGMKASYDGVYLKEMEELARRFGGKMGKTEIIARDIESPSPDTFAPPGKKNPFIFSETQVSRKDMPDSPPVQFATRIEAEQYVARELGLMYDRIERPYLKITPEMAKIASGGLPQWSMRAEPEGEGIPERPIRPDMGMRELARMAGEHRAAKPLSLRDTYGSDPTPEQRAAHAERVSRWETERDRIRDAMVERVQRGADTSMRTLRDVQATDAVMRRLRDGVITPEAAARQIDAISIEQLARQEMRGAEREGRDRVRGARRAREVLDAAARRGEINEEGADLARWLIDQNPDLYDDLAVTAAEAPKGRRGVTAQYDKINRLITLFKGKTNAESAAHEIMHFTEAYLPKDLKEPIRREWRKRLFNEWEKVRDLPVDDARRQFIESILFYHFQSGGFTESAARRRLRAALQLIVDGAVPESYYELANSSEMWAVNSSRLMAERKGMGGGVWAKIKNWYKGMVQRVREILGLRSDAPILRAMDAVLSGKGLDFTGEYLSEGREMDRTRGIAGGPKTMASMEADTDEGDGEEGPVPKPGRRKKTPSGGLPPVYPLTRETRSTAQLVRDWFGESAGVLRGRAGELGNKITERIKSAIDYGRGIKEQFTDISIGIRKLAKNTELVRRLQEPYMHVGWDQTTNSEVPQAYFRYTALLKGWIEPENAAEAEALKLLRELSTKGWNIQADLGANWNYGGIEVPMNRIKEGRSLPNAIMPLLRDLAFDPSHPLRPQAVMEILRATNDMIRRRNEIRRRKMRPDDFIEEPYREYSDVDNFLNRMGEILRSDGEFVSPDGHVAHEFSKDWVIPDLIKIPPGAKYRGGKDGYAPLQQPVLTQRMDGFIDSLAATLGAQIEFGRGEVGYDPNRLGPDGKPMGERPKGQFIGASEIDDLREQYVDYYGGKDTGRGQEEGKIFDRAMRTAQGKSFYTSTPRPDIQTPMGVTWAVWDAAKELARTAGLTVSPLLNTVEMVLGPSASENGWFGILKAMAVAPAALADGFSEVFTGKTFTQAGAEAISSGKLNPYAYAYPENVYASGLVSGLKRVNNALRMINSAVNRAQSQQAARMLIEDVGMPEMREKYGANPNDFFNKERMARRLALRAGIDLEEAHNFFNGTMPADRAERILQTARSRTISVLMGENMAAGEVSRFAQLPAVGELFKFYRWHDSFIRRHFKLLQLSMQSGRRGIGRMRAGGPGGVSMTASGAQEMLKTWMFISANAVAAKAIYMAVLASDEEKKREQRAMRRNPEKYWGGLIATQLLAGPVGFIVRTSTDEVIPLGATLPGSVRNIGEGAFDLIWGGTKAVFGDKKGAAQALAGLEQVVPMTKIYTANFTDEGTGRERLRKIQRAEYRDEMKRLRQEEGD